MEERTEEKRVFILLKKAFGTIAVPKGADLNDYKKTGRYYLGEPTREYKNTPTGYGSEGYAAYMKVFKQYSPMQEKWIEQRLTIGATHLAFARRWSGTDWSDWRPVGGYVNAIVAQGTSGKWSYQKYYNGKMEVRYSGYLTFTSGYVTVNLPQGWLFLVDTDMAKSPIIITVERYIGTNRTADFVCNPGSLSYDSTNNRDQFVLYGRATGSQVSGAHYIDIIINGFYK